ncbi:hypothetical protein C6I21_14205 [Alkalicoccus urumqiensis]|uniref:Uncharacterized protein n=1 Tax=Alkalicoccus urumqiensis TaxID=1548213 RepID=A0A2P6MDX0_ALKUR|nr:hypothetical protein C6I21_14205 [Alkalicoccus urumqiensis]
MSSFLKLNTYALIAAIAMFLMTEIMLNIYRISNVLNISITNGSVLSLLVTFLIVIIFTFVFYRLIDPFNFLFFTTTLVWLPYYLLFIYLFSILFPIENRGEIPPPITGLIIMAKLIGYPFYLGLIFQFKRRKISGAKTANKPIQQ